MALPVAGHGSSRPARTAPVGRISVVIPSHTERRLPQLRAAVASARAQWRTPAEVVVVVDHNEDLLTTVRRELGGVTVLANAFERGVSGNRNTGALHTSTPLVAFLDDDAEAHQGWLEGLVAPFDDPSVVGTGGGIAPRWADGQPAWFPDDFLWAVGGSCSGVPTTTTPIRNVWSANMAVRREVFESVGGFRLGLGKIDDRARPEDTDLCLRMSAASGGQWMFVPDAVVDHPAERATLREFLNRCYQEGRGKVELARLGDGGRDLVAERNYLRRTLPGAVLRGVADTMRGRGVANVARSGAVLAGVTAAAVGGAVESLRIRRGRHAARSRLLPRVAR
jgi:GT2 family glycosyltransferase